ncbi:alcohol dehydrogenase [Kineococcus rhizosphaerae]|uniref:Alcohol dehydrogenase n=2 Tax=Kineococcus rhizosphaerae TaxID=559628 RepID=A0A2T0R5A4_9ACTN|nr:alcohol dehydrogenase [Kineococcus rhizosphaerae]
MFSPDDGLRLVEVPDPSEAPVRGGGVVLDVLAAHVPAYTDVLVAGGRGGFPTPIVLGPGGIGRVRAVADDVFGVRPGDVVVVDGLFRTGRAEDPEEAILGWTGLGGDRPTPTTDRVRDVWRDGTFAQRAVLPERCLVALPGAAGHDPVRLAFLPWLAIAGEAVERGGVAAGQSVAVVGATGSLGTAALLVALSRGAGTVVAAGRDRAVLAELAALDPRVRTVALTGSREVDGPALRAAAGPVDVVVDALGAVPHAEATMSGYDAVRTDGTWVLVGGVRQDLPIPYGQFMHRRLTLRGSWMARPATTTALWRSIRAGVLDLSGLRPQVVDLADPGAALRVAAATGGPSYAVLVP